MALILEIKTTEKGTTLSQVIDGQKRKIAELERTSQRATTSMRSGLGKLRTAYLGVTAAIGGVVYGMVRAIKSTVEYRDRIAKLSRATGVSVEELSALGFAAERSGASMEAVTRGLRGLFRRMQDVKDGLTEGKRAFEQLGVQVLNADGTMRDGTQVLMDVADAISRMRSDTEKAAIAQEIFGRSGVELVPLLEQGRSGIEDLRKEAERLGIVFDEKAAREAEAAADAMTNLNTAVTALKQNIAQNAMPAIVFLANALTGSRISLEQTTDRLESLRKQYGSQEEQLKRIEREEKYLASLRQMGMSADIIRKQEEYVKQLKDVYEQTYGTADAEDKLGTNRKSTAAVTAKTLTVESALAELRKRERESAIRAEAERLYRLEKSAEAIKRYSETVIGQVAPATIRLASSTGLFVDNVERGAEISPWLADVVNDVGKGMEWAKRMAEDFSQRLADALIYGRDLKGSLSAAFKAGLSTLVGKGISWAIGKLPLLFLESGGYVAAAQSGRYFEGAYGRPVPAVLHGGEGVLNASRGMQAIGGPAGLARANAGIPPGGMTLNVTINGSNVDEQFVRERLIPTLRKELRRTGMSLA